MMNKSDPFTPVMVSIKEASQKTGLSYDCIRKLCLAHKIIHIRAGSKYYINFDRLIEFLETSTGEDQQEAD